MVCVSPQYYRQVWHCRSGYSQLDEVGFMMGIIFLPQWVPQAQSVSVGGRCSKPAKDIVDHPGQHFWLASPALIVDGKCHLSSWYEENPLPRMVISVTIADRSITKRPWNWSRTSISTKGPRPWESIAYSSVIAIGRPTSCYIVKTIHQYAVHASEFLSPTLDNNRGRVCQFTNWRMASKLSAGWRAYMTSQKTFPSVQCSVSGSRYAWNIQRAFRKAGLSTARKRW